MNLDLRHQCLIYEGSPSQPLRALAAVIKYKLEEGYRCLYLNSPSMVAGLRSCLAELGIDVAEATAKKSIVLSSEPAISVDGRFDIDLMIEGLEKGIEQALKDGYKGLFATGDMTWEFGAKENFAKLLDYEWRLEKLFHKRKELCGICQYHQDTLSPEILRQALVSHPSIFVNDTLSKLNDHYAQTIQLAEEAANKPELDKAVNDLCQSQSKN